MVAQHILDSVFALAPDDQFELFERLRQRLQATAGPLTDDHRKLLDEELDAFAADGDPGLPWDQVEARTRSTLGVR